MAGQSEQILKFIKWFDQFTMSESGQDELFPPPLIHHSKMANEAARILEAMAHENQEV